MELKKTDFKNKITKIEEDSIAQELGIQVGDILVGVNGTLIEDIIEYQFLLAEDYVELDIVTAEGEEITFEIEKEIDEDLGIEFENPIIDAVKSCRNKCVFCFIDQLPQGMRETLYFKDDDSRLSFLQGNFITMTNMGPKEIQKMIDYRISPVNISVHTTNPELRAQMLGNRFAGDILDKMQQLAQADIQMNGQIVLVKNMNDDKELENTLGDLAKLYPQMHSVAVVPIGVTKYRQGLCPVDIFDKESAGQILEQIDEIQKRFLQELGNRFVFPSDEFYVMAEAKRPEVEAYEDFIQLENGVGLMSKMEMEFNQRINEVKDEGLQRRVSIATGTSAGPFITQLSQRLMEKVPGLNVNVYPILNDFFGHTITVAGLITAQDLLQQLSGFDLGEALLLPRVMMKADEDIFLDNMTLLEFEEKLGVPVVISEVDGGIFIDNLLLKNN